MCPHMTQEPKKDRSVQIGLGVLAVIILFVIWSEHSASERRATAERSAEDAGVSITTLGDGSAAECLSGYGEESVRVALDACGQQLTANTEDSDEWVALAEVLDMCLSHKFTFVDSETMYETGALAGGPASLRGTLSDCQDRLRRSQMESDYWDSHSNG